MTIKTRKLVLARAVLLSLSTLPLALVLPSCGSDDTEVVVAPEGPLGTAEIGPEGGTFTFGPLVLGVPAGALTETVTVAASRGGGDEQLDALEATPITLEPAGLSFEEAASISWSVDAAGGSLALARDLDRNWAILPGSVATSIDGTDTVLAQLMTLGTFAPVQADAEGLLIPPTLREFTPSQTYLPQGTATEVSWTWSYAREANPAPTCKLSGSEGPIDNGATTTLSVDGPTLVTLTCTNAAGSGAATAELWPAVAPTIKGFTASPPAVTGSTTPVTFSWTFETDPQPAPACEIDQGVGSVENGGVAELELPVTSPNRLFTLTCTNVAGSSSSTTLIMPVVQSFPSLTFHPEGDLYELGPITIEVPPGAVREPLEVSARWANSFTPSPNLIAPPIELTPDGTVFHNPVKVTLQYDPAVVEAFGATLPALQLGASFDTGEAWRGIHAEVDTEQHTVTAYVNHFTNLAYDTTRNEQETRPTKSAFEVVTRAEEMFVWMPNAYDGTAVGAVLQDFGEGGTPSQPEELATLSDKISGFSYPPEYVCYRRGKRGNIAKVVAADIDADGRQEMAVLCKYVYEESLYVTKWHIYLTVLDDATKGFKLMMDGMDPLVVDTSQGGWVDSGRYLYDADLAAANVDDDVADELVLTTSDAVDDKGLPSRKDTTLWVLDDALNDLAVLHERTMSNLHYGKVAAGNVDNDEREEIVVGGYYNSDSPGVGVFVYNDANGDYARIKTFHGQSTSDSFLWRELRGNVAVAVADLDGDGRGEIAIMGEVCSQQMLEVFDDRSDGWGSLDYKNFLCNSCNWRPHPASISVGDVNGDYIDDLVIFMKSSYSQPWPWEGRRYSLYRRDTAQQPVRVSEVEAVADGMFFYNASVGVGDVDQDRKDEIVVAHWARPKYKENDCAYNYIAEECTCVAPGRYALSVIGDGRTDSYKEYLGDGCRDGLSGTERPTVGIGDGDGDNTYLQYTGNYDPNAKSGPMPVIAMAAPPHFRSLNQNYKPFEPNTRLQDTGSPNYGQGNTVGEATSSTVGLENGYTQTTQAGASWKIFNVGVGLSDAYEESVSSTTSQKKDIAYGTNFQGSSTENHLVFLVQHFVSYEYRVLGHPDPSFRPQRDGSDWTYSYISIDVPTGDPVAYNWSEHQWRTNYPQYAHWLDAPFKHAPGFPETYPPHSEVEALIKNAQSFTADGAVDDPDDPRFAGWWKNEEYHTVPIGENSSTEAYYQLSNERTNERRRSMKETTTWFFQLPLVGTHEWSVSSFYESSYAVSVGNEVRYAGAVGGVVNGCFDMSTVGQPATGPCAKYDAFPYSWNMFVYNYEPESSDIPPFQVLHFWVDDELYSAHAFWHYYESFARARVASALVSPGDWVEGAALGVPAGSRVWDTCDLVADALVCRDNPNITDPSLFEGAGVLLFQASFEDLHNNEFLFYDGKVSSSAFSAAQNLQLTIRYRITGTEPGLQQAGIGIVPLDDSQYWSFERFELAAGDSAIPARAAELDPILNAKNQETNPYDTGWRTETIDLSQIAYDFDRINLWLDDHNSTNGVYRMYVDYIRIDDQT